MNAKLEDYALIGDLETAALVTRNGSIDWLCLPRFDSDACFASLLGTPEHGRWSLAQAERVVGRQRRYLPDTMIVETELQTETGVVRLTDFMPVRGSCGVADPHRGRPARPGRDAVDLALRFDYGKLPPWTEPGERGFVARIGPDLVLLHMDVPMGWAGNRAQAEFEVQAGEQLQFSLRYATSDQSPPPPVDAVAALGATERFWRDWIGQFDDSRTAWPGARCSR